MGGPRRTRTDDEGVSDTLGVILMVAMSVAMAGAMYVWVFGYDPGEGQTAILGLTSSSGISREGTKTFTVSAVHGDVLWNDLRLQIDGDPLAYDERLRGGLKFCVATSTAACQPTSTWQAAATPVKAGHVLHVKDPNLSGKNLQVIDATTGMLVLNLPLGALADR